MPLVAISDAASMLQQGAVVAYPTEHCFGLGCDPNDDQAVARILQIKRRQRQQGVILIAADIVQLEPYVDLCNAAYYDQIIQSWPGPNTWLIKAKPDVAQWVRGQHNTVAVRVTDNVHSRMLCQQFGGAVVSTSANRHGEPALMDAQQVMLVLGNELDGVVDEAVGGDLKPSTIRDGQTGQRLR